MTINTFALCYTSLRHFLLESSNKTGNLLPMMEIKPSKAWKRVILNCCFFYTGGDVLVILNWWKHMTHAESNRRVLWHYQGGWGRLLPEKTAPLLIPFMHITDTLNLTKQITGKCYWLPQMQILPQGEIWGLKKLIALSPKSTWTNLQLVSLWWNYTQAARANVFPIHFRWF